MRFLHLPSQQIIEASGTRAARYRRSSRFTELTDTDNHYHSPTQSGDWFDEDELQRLAESLAATSLVSVDEALHALYSAINSLPVSSSSPTSPPQSTLDTAHFTQYVRQQLGIEPTSPPESPQTPTIAPETPSDSFDDPDTRDIESMTVSQVLAWVNSDPERARQALDAETQGRNRVTLTSKLRRIR